MAKEKLLTDEELAEAIKPIEPPSVSTEKPSTSSKPSGSSRSKPTGKGDSALIAGLTSSFELLGVGVSFLDEYDGNVIHDKASVMAEAFVELSHHNPRVRRILEQLVTSSAWGGVIMAVGTEVALPIAVHHSWLPEPVNSFMAEAGDIPVKAKPKGETESSLKVVPDGTDTEQIR